MSKFSDTLNDIEANLRTKKRKKEENVGVLAENANRYEMWRSRQKEMHYSFSINPNGFIYWCWCCIVSSACFYNLIFIPLPVFEDIRDHFYLEWIACNAICDLIYALDMLVCSCLNFYEDGCEIVDLKETRANYVSTSHFYLDVLSIVPTDVFMFLSPHLSLLRINRFLKLHRMLDVFELAQKRIKHEIVSISKVMLICTTIFHWNACGFYILSIQSDLTNFQGLNSTFDDDVAWPWPYLPDKNTDFHFASCSHFQSSCEFPVFYYDEEREDRFQELYDLWRNRSLTLTFSQFSKEYSLAMYWSTLTMTTLGEQPSPNETSQSLFEIFDTIVGVVIFAAIMGSVGDLVQNANQAETDWRLLMDGLKQYLIYRNVGVDLQRRILSFCQYEMNKKQFMKESEVREEIPTKLHAQLNACLHWQVLSKCELFEKIEIPLLRDLMSRLVTLHFCPGEVVCAIGDFNREMFIVSSGQLSLQDEYGLTLQTFETNDVIFDRHLIWFNNSKSNNKKTSMLLSNTYSEVFVLYQSDFHKVLEDFPYARTLIHERAYQLQDDRNELHDGSSLDNEVAGLGLEEKLLMIQRHVASFEKEFKRHRRHFNRTTRQFKSRLFQMESELHIAYGKVN